MGFTEFLKSDVFEAFWITALVAYMLGSLSFAIIFSWIFEKKDVRQYGSGNAGATNVFRSIGIMPGALTFVMDFAKGAAAMALSRVIFNVTCGDGAELDAERSIGFCIAGLFALLGHLFPMYFGFRGGKGVLTLGGIMLILSPVRFLIVLTIFIIMFASTQIVSLSSCVCALLYPIVTFAQLFFFYYRKNPEIYNGRFLLVQTLMAVLFGAIVLAKHYTNIQRIFAGTEKKLEIKRRRTA